mmetsp:Transcript_12293/g.19036  ORF Transcript_12293/g.19036 Transcript_12293/m.19036 type:complete len:300 (-) Transcript_12293:1130-2029(-)
MSDRRRFESEWVMGEMKAHSAATRQRERQELQDLVVHQKHRNSEWRLWFDADETIDDFEASAISEALQRNTTITSISLAHISNGTKFLLEMLSPCLIASNNSRIKSLTLFNCGNCGDSFASFLRQEGTTNLESLELTASGMTDGGASDIAQILRANNESLKYLKLDWNCIGTQGEHEILRSLYVNTHLQKIGLYSSGLRKIAIDKAQNLCSRRSERDFELWEVSKREPISSCSLEKMRRGLRWYCAAEDYEKVKGAVSRIKEKLVDLNEKDSIKDIVSHALHESGTYSDEGLQDFIGNT